MYKEKKEKERTELRAGGCGPKISWRGGLARAATRVAVLACRPSVFTDQHT